MFGWCTSQSSLDARHSIIVLLNPASLPSKVEFCLNLFCTYRAKEVERFFARWAKELVSFGTIVPSAPAHHERWIPHSIWQLENDQTERRPNDAPALPLLRVINYKSFLRSAVVANSQFCFSSFMRRLLLSILVQIPLVISFVNSRVDFGGDDGLLTTGREHSALGEEEQNRTTGATSLSRPFRLLYRDLRECPWSRPQPP